MNDARTRGVRDVNPSPTERTRADRIRPFGMGLTLRDHTADVIVEADDESFSAVFAAVASGLTVAMCDDPAETGGRFPSVVRAEGHEVLLFDHLDQLVYERDVHSILLVVHETIVRLEGDEWVIETSVHGVPLADMDVRDVEIVTYFGMRLAETSAGWGVYVVFGV